MRTWLLLLSSGLFVLLGGCSSNNHSGMNMNDHSGTNMAAGQQATPTGPLATGTAVSPIAGARTITATLTDYGVKLDTDSVPAGPVHLVVQNAGQRAHQLQVYPKDAASGGSHSMQMGQGGLVQGAVGFLQLIPAGQSLALDLTLPAGTWEVACHLRDSENGKSFDHYDKGMKTTLRTN